jgi:hypothetical protein
MKFIKSKDGSYHNLNHIRSFYVGGMVESKYRICFSYNYTENNSIGYFHLSENYETDEECKKELDRFMSEICDVYVK